MATRVDFQEFREKLAEFPESPKAIEITTDGKTVGIFLPQRRADELELAATRFTREQLDAMTAPDDADEQKLVKLIEKVQRQERTRRRKAS